jgi:hypothetical protein
MRLLSDFSEWGKFLRFLKGAFVMNKRTLYVLTILTLASATSFAARERVIRFQNHVRLGYDDNIYGNEEEKGSGFITDIVNLSAKANFSSRTDALLYWQPELQYRFDADPETVMYQDLYARLNHAVSQRTFLTISDRFRYQEKEGQTGVGLSTFDQNYFENDLQAALDYTINSVSYLKFGAGYDFRVWEDSDYGEWHPENLPDGNPGGNDFDRINANGTYIRQLKPNKTQGILGVQYADLTYEGSRGGYEAMTFLGGVDQNFNQNVTGFGRLGVSLNDIDGGSEGTDNDTTSPYFQAGLEVNPTSRTSFNGTLGYSLQRSDNSAYNAQEQFSFGLGARQDLTAKISLAGALAYIHSNYDSEYSYLGLKDATDDYVTLSLRCSYQVNRNNFVEAGYFFANRSSDFSDWTRNRIDVAWRLRL